MSLATNVVNLATRVATEFKAVRAEVAGRTGDLATLTTSAKSSLVAAINEVSGAVAGASGIDDTTVGTSTSWSSSKTQTEIGDAVAAVDLIGIIDDVTPSTATVWSSTKTGTEIAAAVGAVDVPVLTDLIDDVTPSAATVYSSTKTDAQVATAVAALVDGAPGDLDTLRELGAALGDQDDALAAINTALGNRVRFDAAQVLTDPQQVQARSNIAAAAAAELDALAAAVGTVVDGAAVDAFEAGLL